LAAFVGRAVLSLAAFVDRAVLSLAAFIGFASAASVICPGRDGFLTIFEKLATGCFAHLPFLILNYLAWHIVYALSIIDTLPDRRFQDFYVFIFGRNALHNTLIYDTGNGDHRRFPPGTGLIMPIRGMV
jgi:hypothetical protein